MCWLRCGASPVQFSTCPIWRRREQGMDSVVITALDQEGRGIAHVDGKAVFVEGALIGERASIEVFQRKPKYDVARAMEIHAPSASRTTPRCPYFGVCGGCSVQHAE